MKKFARNIVVAILGWQVRRLCQKNTVKIVGIVGGIGKTSTKFAVATVLSQKYRVQFQQGNYNDPVSVPLVFFGLQMPNLLDPFAWLKVFMNIESQLRKPYPFDVVLAELGTDKPGDIPVFGKYLTCDIAVVTALVPEHMEFFADMDEVAKEELTVVAYSKSVVVNVDLCDKKYLSGVPGLVTFGTGVAEYHLGEYSFSREGAKFSLFKADMEWIACTADAVAKSELYSATAASVVADKFGLSIQEITAGIAYIRAVSGRMQRLKGINDSLILDETYNASPEAMIAALDSLYGIEATQRIAILGNMNELGDYANEAHTTVGEHCDPEKVNLVVTIGPDANTYLAPAAKSRGCTVQLFDDPYTAGEFVKAQIKPGAVILAKGSQNKVYAEEAVKLLLRNPDDSQLLVRQSPSWIVQKQNSFKKGV